MVKEMEMETGGVGVCVKSYVSVARRRGWGGMCSGLLLVFWSCLRRGDQQNKKPHVAETVAMQSGKSDYVDVT